MLQKIYPLPKYVDEVKFQVYYGYVYFDMFVGIFMLVYAIQVSKFVLLVMCITLLIQTLRYGIGSLACLLKLLLHVCFKNDDMWSQRRCLHSMFCWFVMNVSTYFCVSCWWCFFIYVAYYFCEYLHDVVWGVYFLGEMIFCWWFFWFRVYVCLHNMKWSCSWYDWVISFSVHHGHVWSKMKLFFHGKSIVYKF